MDALKGMVSCAVFLWLVLVFGCCSVLAAPVSYINENVEAVYFWNGTLDGNISRTGSVEVSVGNTQDVMQYLLLELSGTSGTNLQNTTAYNDVAASPNPGDRTRMYVNTTKDMKDLSYEITNSSLAPVIGICMDYRNSAGGRDIYAGGTNVFLFNLTLNTTKNVSNVSLVFQAARDTMGVNDSMGFFSPSADSGHVQTVDTDSDGIYDRILWNGDLSEGTDVVLSFRGSTLPGSSFDESYMYVDLDSEETVASSSASGQTFTGISFVDRFSRGPVRQGIEMAESDYWYVRGFIRNMANGLDYVVHGWELYKIGESYPVANSSDAVYLEPEETMYTDWVNTAQEEKAYYSSAFDWEVTWGGSGYSSTTQSSMHMPTLYEIDAWADKTAVLDSNGQGGRTVSITDTIRHLGYSGLLVDRVEIDSAVPHLSQSGTRTSWSVSNVTVYYSNTSGLFDVTDIVNITTRGSDPDEDGFVRVNASGLVAALGGLKQNEDIILAYQISSSAHRSNQVYAFLLSGTITTSSGTPVTRTADVNLTIPGVPAVSYNTRVRPDKCFLQGHGYRRQGHKGHKGYGLYTGRGKA